MSSSKMIVLMSSNGEKFEVEETVALESQTIKHMIEDNYAETIIPLTTITGKILALVIAYCKRHANSLMSSSEDKLKKFDAEFVKVDKETLFNLTLAANFLNITSLLEFISQIVADMIKQKTPEEIYKIFNIVNDFTPEEEEQIHGENAWAFE